MVGKNYSSPEVQTNISYGDSILTDTSSLVKWFDLYHDEVLNTIIKTVLDSNRNMLTSVARIEEARSQSAIVRANLYPQFNYSAQAGGGSAGENAEKTGAGRQGGFFSAFGLLSWEIDIWGKLRHARNAAEEQFLASVNTRIALQVSLIAEAASNYFLLRDLDNRLAIAEQTLENRKASTKIISERFNKGYIPELDKLQAMQQEAIAAATIPALRRQITQVENSLQLLMGKGPGSIDRGVSNQEQILSPDIPIGLPSQLLERRPDIISVEHFLKSQFEQIGVAQANRFPTFSLTAALGFASDDLSSFINSKGLVANGFGNVFGPIFNFNQRKNIVEAERHRYEQFYYQYQQTVISAFGDVSNALASYRTYSEEYEQRKIQADAAEKSLTLSKARYDLGYTSYLEVIIMENNLFDAQFQESIALQGKRSSIVQLYKSLGGGW